MPTDSRFLELLKSTLVKRKNAFDAAIMNNMEFDALKELKTEIKLLEREIDKLSSMPATIDDDGKQ